MRALHSCCRAVMAAVAAAAAAAACARRAVEDGASPCREARKPKFFAASATPMPVNAGHAARTRAHARALLSPQPPLQGGVLLAATACAAVAAWRTELLSQAALPSLLVRPSAAARGTAGRLRRLFFLL